MDNWIVFVTLFSPGCICDGRIGPLQHSVMNCCLCGGDMIIGKVGAATQLQF